MPTSSASRARILADILEERGCTVGAASVRGRRRIRHEDEAEATIAYARGLGISDGFGTRWLAELAEAVGIGSGDLFEIINLSTGGGDGDGDSNWGMVDENDGEGEHRGSCGPHHDPGSGY